MKIIINLLSAKFLNGILSVCLKFMITAVLLLYFTEEMDVMLEFCFRCAIKSSVKKNDLPLLTSTFYRAHMMKYW